MARISELPELTALDGADEIVVTDSGTSDLTTRASVDTLVTYLEANLDLGTTIDGINDVPGLQTALTALEDGKANVDHTHIIDQVLGLRDELDTKYDSSTAGILGATVIIGSNSININDVVNERVADITGVSPTDARIPGNVTIGNRLVFTSTNGQIGEETPQQFKADLLLNNVDNTADVDKPISSATQSALDLKLGIDAFTEGQAAQDALIAVNTAKTSISDDQSAAIVANTAKTSYPSSASTKLAGIEAGADVTDTANVWSSLGISTEGRTGYVLSERGVFVELPDSAGNVTQLVSSITTQQTGLTSGGGVSVFTITGVAGTVVNLSITSSNPANWITDSSIDNAQVTLDSEGSSTVSITVPSFSSMTGSRSFQVQAQVEGDFQTPVTSEVVTQYSATAQLLGVSLNVINFGNAGVTETITVTGLSSINYNLSLVEVTPAGWITSGALSGTNGTLDGNGTDSTYTITIPTAQDDTVNRSFKIRASVVGDAGSFVDSSAITQVHTQSTSAGNLTADVGAIYATPNIDFSVNITQGDGPFEIVLNNHPTDKTINPLSTETSDDIGQVNFRYVVPSTTPDGDTVFYVHINDADGDIVVDMETISILNLPPSGSMSQTMGATSPAFFSDVELTASFSDPEGDNVTYQWQRMVQQRRTVQDLSGAYDLSSDEQTVLLESGAGASNAGNPVLLISGTQVRWGMQPAPDTTTATTKSTLATSTNTGWGQAGEVVVLRDANPQDAGGSSNDRLFWGASAAGVGGGVIAFWNTGEDHRYIPPFLTLSDNSSGSSSNYGGDDIFQHTTLTTEEITALKAIATNETTSGTSNYYTIPEANWETWEGTQTVPYDNDVPSIMLVYADGADHETDLPVAIYETTGAGTHSAWSGSRSNPSVNPTYAIEDFLSMVSVSAEGSFGWRSIPASNVEIIPNGTVSTSQMWEDIEGETESTIEWEWGDVYDQSIPTTDIVYSASLAAGAEGLPSSAMDGRNNFVSETDFGNSFVVFIPETTSSPITAAWSGDKNLSIDTPDVAIDPQSISFFVLGSNFAAFMPLSETETQRLIGLTDISTNTSSTGATSTNTWSSIPNDQVKTYIDGRGEYANIGEPIGEYRCIVMATSGDTTTITSNEVELT